MNARLATLSVLVALAALVAVPAAAQIPNPSDADTNRARSSGPCSDPWVTMAINFVNNGVDPIRGTGNVGECATWLYRGGRWSSFDDLVKGVRATKSTLQGSGISLNVGRVSQGFRVETLQGGSVIGYQLIGHDGATLIGHDGATLIGDGGGTLRSLLSGEKTPLGNGLYLSRR